MKRFSNILFMMLGIVMLGISSCTKEGLEDTPTLPPEPSKPEVEEFLLEPSTIVFDAEGTPQTVVINTKYDWKISVPAAASWCTVEPLSGGPGITEVKLTPAPFTDRKPRNKQLLTVSYHGTFSMITISQELPNKVPTAPVLLTPENGAKDVKTNGTFTWKPSTDPDGDELTYKVAFSTDNGSTWKSYTTTSASYRVIELLEKQKEHQWKVTCTDAFGGSAESDVWTFTTGDGGGYADGEITRYQTESAGAPSPVHLIFMGDGYIKEDYMEGGAFDRDVEKAVSTLLSVEPFATYKDWFRITTVAVYSEERGATVKQDMDGCKVQTKKTAFNCVLDGGISTGVSCDMERAFAYAKKVQGVSDKQLENTTVFMLVNLNVYAGTCLMERTGRSVSICPVGPTFGNIIVHEGGGHGFGRLVDEYRYTDAELPLTDRNKVIDWRSVDEFYAYNISFTNDKSKAHWGHFIGRSGYDAVGFYEGAYLYQRGVWRPENISCMEDNRLYFNAPSREAIVRRIHRAAGSSFSMDTFYSNDKVKSDNTTKGAYVLDFKPLAPPVMIDK